MSFTQTINPLLLSESAPSSNHFEGDPFRSFLVDETGELILHPNWRAGLTGRALEFPFQNSHFGNVFGALDDTDQPTQLGKQILQWGSWFINGNNLPTTGNQTDTWEFFMRNEIVQSLNDQDYLAPEIILTLRNLGLLSSLRATNLTQEDWKILKSIDLSQISLLKAYEIAETQPGYWGKRRTSHKIDHYNEIYGKGNWTVGFNLTGRDGIGHLLTTHQFAERFFQGCLLDYFSANPDQLNFIAKNACELFEDVEHFTDDIGMGYDISSYLTTTKYQFAIIRRLMLLKGLKFEGANPIAIAGARKDDPLAGPDYQGLGGIGRILHPGAIALPISLQQFIPSEEVKVHGWWEAWEKDETIMNDTRFPPAKYGDKHVSLEQAYHRCKCIIVRKNPSKSIPQLLCD